MTTMADNKDKKVLNVPHLRFPEFSGEWEKYTIGDLCEEFKSGKNIKAESIQEEGVYPVFGGNGLRGYTDRYNHDGDYVLIGRQGALCGNVRFVTGKTYITEHAIAAKATNDNYTRYLEYLFVRLNLGQFSDQSAQPGLAVNKLLKIETYVPSKAEQLKIAFLLRLLDERIATQNKIIEDLKKLKSAIIERAYCDRSYHPYRIGDVIEQISERNKDKSIDMVLSVSNKQGFINQSEQFEDRIIASEDTSNYKIVHKNDFAYNPARINVGSIARLTTIEKGIVSPMYICFRVRKEVVSEYLEHFFSTSYFFYEMQKRLEGSVRQCLSFEGICNIPIYIPSSEEQHTIGKKISVLLGKIDIETHYHFKLVEQKHYLLRQMFI
jgi:type I restriction enzyme S subunit